MACAVGTAVMQCVLEDGFLDQIVSTGNYFRQQLSHLVDSYNDIFTEIQGRGLMLGLQCAPPNTEIVEALRAQHLLTVGAGDNTIRPATAECVAAGCQNRFGCH